MGAQESTVRKKAEDLEIGEEYSKKSAIYSLWSHVNPYTKKRNIKGTIFTKDFGSFVDEKKYFENGIKHLKQLRHPHIVSFIDCSNVNGVLSLLTERVHILDICIDSLTSIEIQSGLCQIREVLIFLHEKARICHNSISPASIFVTPNGDWKLGGFEFAQSLDESKAPFQSEFYKRARMRNFSPDSSANNCPLSRDFYGFGKLITYALHHIKAEEVEALDSLKSISVELTSLESNVETLAKLTDEMAFSNDLIKIESFLNTVHLKSDEEKDEFYKSVIEKLYNLPRRVVARRLSRLFLSRYVLLEPRSHTFLYPALLTPSVDETEDGVFPVELFRDYVVPEIVRVFLIRDTSIRCGLLSHFDRYAQYIPIVQLEDFVVDEISSGAHDVNERLVAASLRAMATLVPLLGAERVCGWKCSKLYSDGTPKLLSPNGVDSTGGSPVLPPAPRPAVAPKEFDSSSYKCYGLEKMKSIPIYRPVEETISPQEPDVWDDDKGWNDEWADDQDNQEKAEVKEEEGEEEQSTSSSLENRSPTPEKETKVSAVPNLRLTSAVSASNIPTNKLFNSKFGTEFEISAKTKSEDDFFADMEPEIKTRGTIIDQLIAHQEELSKKQIENVNNSKFVMASDEAAFESAAWSDGEDWGDDIHGENSMGSGIGREEISTKLNPIATPENQNGTLVEEVHMD